MVFNALAKVPNESNNYTKVLLKKGIPHHYDSNLVIRTMFSGQYDYKEGLDADFKDCLFKNVEFVESSFEYDDFRSVVFYNARFIGCDFTHSDISQCWFYGCYFIDCDLSETASFEVRYIGCEFKNCIFNRVIIRSARIHECIFDTIECSNRLFEDCVFSRTKFVGLSLKLSTIIYNYGITKSAMEHCKIFNDNDNSLVEDIDIENEANCKKYTNLELFKLSYYLDQNLTANDSKIEELLTFNTFFKEAVNIQSLILLSENLLEYLFSLYDEDLLEIYYLFKINYIFEKIVEHYPTSKFPENIKLQVLCWHINLALQSYFSLEKYITGYIRNNDSVVTLITLDNLDLKLVTAAFDRLSNTFGFQYNIIAKNSPHFVEITGSIVSFLYLVFNCLKKINFERITHNNLLQIETEDVNINIRSKQSFTKINSFKDNQTKIENGDDRFYSENNAIFLKDIKDTIDIVNSLTMILKDYASNE